MKELLKDDNSELTMKEVFSKLMVIYIHLMNDKLTEDEIDEAGNDVQIAMFFLVREQERVGKQLKEADSMKEKEKLAFEIICLENLWNGMDQELTHYVKEYGLNRMNSIIDYYNNHEPDMELIEL